MTQRHAEDILGGVVEAALNRAMYDEKWLSDMAGDSNIGQNTPTEIFQALEGYICDHLARITKDEACTSNQSPCHRRRNSSDNTCAHYPDPEPLLPVAYLQDADGNERTLHVTEPDPADGTYCVFPDDEGQGWIRIVPTNGL